MTPASTALSAAPTCPDCGGLLTVEGGTRCGECAPDAHALLLHATLSEGTCALGHPGCAVSTSDDLAI